MIIPLLGRYAVRLSLSRLSTITVKLQTRYLYNWYNNIICVAHTYDNNRPCNNDVAKEIRLVVSARQAKRKCGQTDVPGGIYRYLPADHSCQLEVTKKPKTYVNNTVLRLHGQAIIAIQVELILSQS